MTQFLPNDLGCHIVFLEGSDLIYLAATEKRMSGRLLKAWDGVLYWHSMSEWLLSMYDWPLMLVCGHLDTRLMGSQVFL